MSLFVFFDFWFSLDNSEFARNGDFTPTRFQAQLDAVHLIFTAKTQSNPESTVGLMTMGGESPEVLATLTSQFGKILSATHNIQVNGNSHFATSVQIAGLALKHRQNKVQRQRIIAFVGSPLDEDSKELVKLAKKMKKNNVAIDFINFGQEQDNGEKLEKFIESVNSNNNSHLLTIPPGPHLLSDVIASSEIINEEGGVSATAGAGAGAGMGGGDMFDLGVDASVDPELALALRMSLEDERQRQEREKLEKEKAAKEEQQAAMAAASTGEQPEGSDGQEENPDKMDTQ